MNATHVYDMLIQDLTAQIPQANADRDSKPETKAKKLQINAEGDLTDTTTSRDADDKYLADLTAMGELKTADFEIMSSNDISGNSEKHLPSFVQKTALTQLRADTRGEAQQLVMEHL